MVRVRPHLGAEERPTIVVVWVADHAHWYGRVAIHGCKLQVERLVEPLITLDEDHRVLRLRVPRFEAMSYQRGCDGVRAGSHPIHRMENGGRGCGRRGGGR